jgi:antitoxin component YwqK of YwqJK toxin-antitoxin module
LQRDYRTNAKGNKEGISKTFAEGVLVADEQYQAGSNIGLQKYFYNTGGLKRLAWYEMSKPVTASSPFIQTQEKASMSFNENGKLNDLRCARSPAIEFEKMSDQILCGFKGPSQVELYSGDILAMRKSFLGGDLVATVSYWENGNIRHETASREGKFTESRFSQSGTKVKELVAKLVPEQGGQRRVKELERDFHTSGTLIAESRWANEELTHQKTWYLNGQAKSHLEYSGQAFARIDFHDNGVPSFKGRFSTSRQGSRGLGEHQSFDEKGRLRFAQFYDDKGLVARERQFNEGGEVLRDDALFEDGSRKAFAK